MSADAQLGVVRETNPNVDFVVADDIAEGSDAEFDNGDDRDDVLVGGEVHDVVGLWDAEEGELRVRDVREEPKDVFCVQLALTC